MPDNHPLFDDNDLPDWMKGADEAAADASGQAASPAPGDDLLDWMRPPADAADAPGDLPDFGPRAWDTPADTPSGGAPPSQAAANPNAPPKGSGLTGLLPWRQGVSDPADNPTIPTGTNVDWLDSPLADPNGSLLTADTDLGIKVPAKFRANKEESTKPLPTAQPNASAPTPPDDVADVTYDEWERRQTEKEQAAQRDPNDALLEAIPDWLSEPPGASVPDHPPTSEAEFMPDWLADRDAVPGDALPDWFDASPSPDAASPAPSAPTNAAPASAAASALPDWMQPSAAAPDESADWMSDFVSELPPEGAPSRQNAEPSLADVPESSAEPGDLPDWMRDMAASAPPATPRRPSAPPASTPPARPAPASTTASATTSTAASSGAVSADVPDWLRDMAPVSENFSSGGVTGALPDLFPADLPDNRTASSTPASALAPGELPDWLTSVQAEDAPSAPSKPSQTTAAGLNLQKNLTSRDLDALLGGLPSQGMVAQPRPEVSASTLDDFDLDSILGPAPELPPDAAEPSAPPLPEAAEPSVPSLPGQPANQPSGGMLRRLPAPGQAAAPSPARPVPALAAGQTAAPSLTRSEVPEFIRELRAGPVSLNVGETQVELNEAPLAQLSDQLKQLRERSQQAAPSAAAPTSAAAPLPNSNPLAGLSETLSAEPLIGKAAAQPTTPVQTVVSDLQARRVKLVQALLETDEADSAAKTAQTAGRVRVKADRLLITLALLLVLVAPFLTDAFNLVALPNTGQPTAAQAAVFSAMDGLRAGQPLLVAFEYGPTGAGELDDLARALLADVFKKGAKPVIVSTNPSGIMHAESLLAVFGHDAATLTTLNRADKPLAARVDYVILRYLPAGAAGVRSIFSAIAQGGFQAQSDFLTDSEGQPSGLSLSADVPMLANAPVIVLAETPEDVRNWAEQYRAPADSPSANPPRIVLAAAAAADATARAYSAALSSTLIGPLIGLRDATVYRLLRQPPAKASDAKALDQRWQSTGLGALLAGVIIFLGSMLSLIQAVRRRGVRR